MDLIKFLQESGENVSEGSLLAPLRRLSPLKISNKEKSLSPIGSPFVRRGGMLSGDSSSEKEKRPLSKQEKLMIEMNARIE